MLLKSVYTGSVQLPEQEHMNKVISKTLILTLSLLALPAAADEANDNTDKAQPEARLPLQELRAFADAFNQIRRTYVEEVDDKNTAGKRYPGHVG